MYVQPSVYVDFTSLSGLGSRALYDFAGTMLEKQGASLEKSARAMTCP